MCGFHRCAKSNSLRYDAFESKVKSLMRMEPGAAVQHRKVSV
jgi:hypothetical protein